MKKNILIKFLFYYQQQPIDAFTVLQKNPFLFPESIIHSSVYNVMLTQQQHLSKEKEWRKDNSLKSSKKAFTANAFGSLRFHRNVVCRIWWNLYCLLNVITENVTNWLM